MEKERIVIDEIQDYAIRIAKDIQSYAENGGDITKMNASTVYEFLTQKRKLSSYQDELSAEQLYFLPCMKGGVTNENSRAIQ